MPRTLDIPCTDRMTPGAAITLRTAVASLRGVSEKVAHGLRLMGIKTVADLIRHIPHRYEREHADTSIGRAGEIVGPNHHAQANVAVVGEVAVVRPGMKRRTPLQATLMDPTGTIQLLWFNAPWMRGKLHPGMSVRVSGIAKRHGDYLQMANPQWQPITENEAPSRREDRLIPVYRATELVSSQQIERLEGAVLPEVLPLLEDHLTNAFRAERGLPTLAQAYRCIHAPEHEDAIGPARRRLIYDECLLHQLAVILKRHQRHELLRAPALTVTREIDRRIRARFGFELTPDQDAVIGEMLKDLALDRPMNRLLQGDVGSGKTAVALYAMLLAIARGHQAALMAPTELLAEQHFQSITRSLSGARVRIALLTGSHTAAQRTATLRQLASGSIDLVIGTHSLINASLKFRSLALVVIDEQHRFGVHQRAQLRSKSSRLTAAPHTLVMTATPIPRTLSLTLFGDLDISTIRSLPPNRSRIITRHLPTARIDEAYRYVAQRLQRGDQAYVVAPVIDESVRNLRAVQTLHKQLTGGPLAGRRVGVAHGRMDAEARGKIIQQFHAHKLDAIITTTVIEVGVDVPNATIMVIEHADQFGLAQLHQLRGRVGRGPRQSLCLLIADPATPDAQARIQAMLETTDGFVIAERDLELRGPGELLGTRQSGAASFQLAEFPRDLDLLRLARRDAEAWIKRNPSLCGSNDELIRKRLFKAHGKTLGLADVV